MITITCINPNCTTPNRQFKGDETLHGDLATPTHRGRQARDGYCPFCGAENPVWVKKPKPMIIIRKLGRNGIASHTQVLSRAKA